MRKILFIGLMIVLGASECKNSNMKDDNLSIVQHDYIGSELKLNGFYYLEERTPNGIFLTDISSIIMGLSDMREQ